MPNPEFSAVAHPHKRKQHCRALFEEHGWKLDRIRRETDVPISRLQDWITTDRWTRAATPYSPEEKHAALVQVATSGTIKGTSRETGISRRTLGRWLRVAPPIFWRCYCVSDYGLRVTEALCPRCGAARP